MASKKKFPAAIVVVCAVAALVFFIVIVAVASNLGDGDPYEDEKPDDGIVYDYMYTDIVWAADRSGKVTTSMAFRVTDYQPTHGIYFDIPVNSGERIRDMKVKSELPSSLSHEAGNKIVRVVLGDPDRTLRRDTQYRMTLDYTYICPAHPEGKDIFDIVAIGYGHKSVTKDCRVKITYPDAPEISFGADYGVWVAGKKLDASDARVTVSDGGKTIAVDSSNLPAFGGVRVKSKMKGGALSNYSAFEMTYTLVIGLVLVAAVLIVELLVAKNKPLTPIVDYYPPRIDSVNGEKMHMLPVQMGKIIDDNCSNEDVTSLIFYWASKGFIEIDEREDDTYLTKLKPLENVTKYEQRMFDKLFANRAKDDEGRQTVGLKKLTGKFANEITVCKNAVNSEFKDKFYVSGYTTLSRVMMVLCALYALGITVLTSLRVGAGMYNVIGVLSLIPVALSAVMGTIIAKMFFKLPDNKRRLILLGYFVLTALVSFAVSVTIPYDVARWPERLVFAACLAVASSVAPFLLVRKNEYNEQLNSILGFRNFLRDAEKDRLELLLEEDPQYYYNILPYANVLGVSDIWERKFAGLTLEPPTYYRSYRSGVFDYMLYRSLSHNIRTNLTYVPPSPSSRSFSGGGGHSSGGGGSFGGFGGGGSGRW